MATALSILLNISIILFVGTLLSIIANRIKIPEILLFILLGFGIQQLSLRGVYGVDLPFIFIATAGLLALALIVFEGSAHFRFRQLDKLSTDTIKLVGLLVVLHMTIFTLVSWGLLGTSFRQAALFAAIVAGTSAPVTLMLLKAEKGPVLDLLKFESLINTPVNAILPFLIVDILYIEGGATLSILAEQFKPLLLKFAVAIGIGVIAGIILFKVLHGIYSKVYSPMAVMIASLLTYGVAEALGGSGVLAVLSLGILFGNLSIERKGAMLEVQSVFARSLYILVFVLFGTLISFPVTDVAFLITIGVLLATYYVIRFITLEITQQQLMRKERVFMALLAPNGLTAIAVTLVLANLAVPGMSDTLKLVGAFVVGQLVVSAVVLPFEHKLLDPSKHVKKKPAAAEPAKKSKKS